MTSPVATAATHGTASAPLIEKEPLERYVTPAKSSLGWPWYGPCCSSPASPMLWRAVPVTVGDHSDGQRGCRPACSGPAAAGYLAPDGFSNSSPALATMISAAASRPITSRSACPNGHASKI